jgi:hypothetical protein
MSVQNVSQGQQLHSSYIHKVVDKTLAKYEADLFKQKGNTYQKYLT